MIEEKISQLNNLLHNDDKSLVVILSFAIQLADLKGDSTNKLLFEKHVQGLSIEQADILFKEHPTIYGAFFTDRKRTQDTKSFLGSISSLETRQENLDRDIDAAAEEVKRVRAAQPIPATFTSAASVGAANAILNQYRLQRNEINEVLNRIRLRVLHYVRDAEIENTRSNSRSNLNSSVPETDYQKVFLVHGHDEESKQLVARFLENVGLKPIILHEQASQGRTLIEKFEDHSDVAFAVVLLTADDEGRLKDGSLGLKNRARQNVVLELGFFYAKLSRAKVCAMIGSEIEKPSDMDGIIYIPLDRNGGWKIELAKELRAAKLNIDMNQI